MPACLCRQLAARIVPGRLSWLVGVKAASVEARRVAASLVDSLEGDHEAACPAVACLAAACPAAAYPAVACRVAACLAVQVGIPVAACRAAACRAAACQVVAYQAVEAACRVVACQVEVGSLGAACRGVAQQLQEVARAETGTFAAQRRRLVRRLASCAPNLDHQPPAQVLPVPGVHSWEQRPFHDRQPCRRPDRRRR